MTANNTGFVIPLARPDAMKAQTEYTLSFDYRGTATSAGTIYLLFTTGGNLYCPGGSLTVSETEWQHFEKVCK